MLLHGFSTWALLTFVLDNSVVVVVMRLSCALRGV